MSLVFLVQEVRYNTLVLERQAVMDRTAAFNSPFLADSSLASILVRIKRVDGYDPVETAFVEWIGRLLAPPLREEGDRRP